jgi:hypothetical protein
MAKKSFTSARDLLEGLKDDILYLLLTILAHREKQRLPNLAKMSREDLVLELALLESGTRDIVARLTALDDDGPGSRSFPNALAAMNREGLEKRRADELKAQVKAYRGAVNDLKVNHRNSYISHVQEFAEVVPRIVDKPVRFEAPAGLAVNVFDALMGRQVGYRFRVGSQEPEIDLRARLSG